MKGLQNAAEALALMSEWPQYLAEMVDTSCFINFECKFWYLVGSCWQLYIYLLTLLGTEGCKALQKLDEKYDKALQKLDKYDIVVKIQRDEPLIEPEIIHETAKAMQVHSSLFFFACSASWHVKAISWTKNLCSTQVEFSSSWSAGGILSAVSTVLRCLSSIMILFLLSRLFSFVFFSWVFQSDSNSTNEDDWILNKVKRGQSHIV